MIFFCAAWAGHTDISREMAQNFANALDAHQVKVETCAGWMGLDREDLSKQLAGQKPLNLWRIGFVMHEAPHVYLTFLELETKRFGATLITAEDRAFVLSAARLGQKKMARMLPGFFHEEREVG